MTSLDIVCQFARMNRKIEVWSAKIRSVLAVASEDQVISAFCRSGTYQHVRVIHIHNETLPDLAMSIYR